MWSTISFIALLVAPLARCGGSVNVQGQSLRKPSGQDGVVRPFTFNQRLLICNAYPSESPIIVKKNKDEWLADEKNGIAFRECRYISSHVQEHDKLDLMLKDIEIHGTFEVGELPTTDAVLLLVLEKRTSSPLVSFQSFAFPTNADSRDAQLAVIDTYQGNSTMPHLKMEDHVTGKEEKTVSKRVEQLNFNRVYAVEEGAYDASISDHVGDPVFDEKLETKSKKMFQLKRNHNYVVLRTGDVDHFPQQLVLFPNDQSGSRRGAIGAFLGLAAAVMVMVF